MAEKKTEKEVPRFQLVEIPTQMGIVCRDNEKELDLSQFDLLVQLGNDMSEIKKGIVGEK